MSARRPGAVVLGVVTALAAVVGVAGGALLATVLREEPATMPAAAPVPAVSPSYPVDPPPEIEPDPGSPSLSAGLPLRPVEVGIKPFGLRLPVPVGWTRSNSLPGEYKWRPPDFVENGYFLRVRLITGFQTLESAVQDRLDALEGASDVEQLAVEERDDRGFTVTYVSARHRRVAVERFLSFNGSTAYAVVAVIGRERDALGLADLAARIEQRAAVA
ncbi:hypothetical protein [Nocardioides abyssi]|uniref:DUF4245 domain-containing protein n=1 Tax=Nocardioides abyssi TaxID=3058370 RepID=A0ABT8ERX3_9ACTN|nr:hypothetical protein [Nocardioides abyssi]MDN4160898.1 hypothetical protein [Nocardioides abyssi]